MKIPIRIVVHEADDDFRHQIEMDLKTDIRFQIIQSYKTLVDFKLDIGTKQADVILLNWNFNHAQLFDFIATIKSKNSASKIIITFDFLQPDFISEILKKGATGFLLKPFSSNEIFKIVTEKSFNIVPKKLAMHVGRLNIDAAE